MSEGESLALHTTFHIGGKAKEFSECDSIEKFHEGVRFAITEDLPWVVIGGGSNILVGDDGYQGVVLKNTLKGIDLKMEGNSALLVSGGGEIWDEIVEYTTNAKLWGLENLSGIPGTVGGAPIQNIGAYGVDVASTIEWVEAYDPIADTVRRFTKNECEFGYRDSIFNYPEKMSFIVTHVAFRLTLTPSPVITYPDLQKIFSDPHTPANPTIIREEVLKIRSKKFPSLEVLGTAGSFFKNPIVGADALARLREAYKDTLDIPAYLYSKDTYKLSAAFIIDKISGLRGTAEGRVHTYEHQALVIVAETDATAREVLQLASRIQRIVYEKTRIILEPEVRFIGCKLATKGE